MKRLPTAAPHVSLTSVMGLLGILLLAGAGCRNEVPAYASGIVEGGPLSREQKARHHYDSEIRPSSARPYSRYARETFETEEGRVRKIVSYSKVYVIDGVIPAMAGPRSTVWVTLDLGAEEPELLWIKGVQAEIVDETGEPLSGEFQCHMVANVGSREEHDARLGLAAVDSRFAALAQGHYHKEYPRGFGMPVLSTDRLAFASQVLNHDASRVADGPLLVRHKIVTHVIRDRDLAIQMKPITSTFAQAMVVLGQEHAGDGYYGIRVPDEEEHGASCSVGRMADSKGNVDVSEDPYGRRFTPHWILEPGSSTNQTLVTKQLQLRYDTRIHSIDAHMHAFGRWIELRDLTTQETIFRAEAEQARAGTALASIQSYRSEEGIPVYADHEYAVVSHYDNTSADEQDAMAILYIGVHDEEFDPALVWDPTARERVVASRRAAALERLQRAVTEDPEDPVAHYDLGQALFHSDRALEAAEHFRIAARLDPDDARPQRGLARALERARELESR